MKKSIIYQAYLKKTGEKEALLDINLKSISLSMEIIKFLEGKKNLDDLQHAVAQMEIGIEMSKKILNPNDINKYKGIKLKQLVKKIK